MPATEKTWRDQIRMHVVFGITSLVMLVATVWMLAKDQRREWRKWQLDNRSKEEWTTAAQLAQQTAVTQASYEQLSAKYKDAQSAKVEPAAVEQFKARVAADAKRAADAGIDPIPEPDTAPVEAAAVKLNAAPEHSNDAADARTELKDAMMKLIRAAKRREDTLVSERKAEAANQTATVSERGIAIGDGRPAAAIEEIQGRIDKLADHIAKLDVGVDAAKSLRLDLESIYKSVDGAESDLKKQLGSIDTDLNRLRAPLNEDVGWFLQGWRKITEPINRLPVLDALYNGNIKLTQVWLPDITINYNFSSVARYDRCMNCHKAIDQTAPGSATEPAYPNVPRDQRIRVIQLPTPESAPPEGDDAPKPTLASVYGMTIAPHGQIDPDAVTIQTVLPGSLAARAGLEMGDIIQKISGGIVHSEQDVVNYLIYQADWGKPVALTISRGLPQPFTSHPRLDLFVGASSPHKMGQMGCTICHDGQGSATDFKWASHAPNSPAQAIEWAHKYGWFDNHNWIFPMVPERFIESNCLKCHHDVVELEPSERFPDPPAPNLVAGYELVRQYGCFGCHEINGFDGPSKRVGPDLRLEPNVYDVAVQILQDRGLTEEERGLATTLVHSPDADDARHQLFRSIKQDAELATSGDAGAKIRLTSATHALADGLKDVETPGRFRKVGPSLRHLDSKVDFSWLFSWIHRPADFRPSTRMPQFFGHFQHLGDTEKEFTITDPQGNKVEMTDSEYTKRFEAVEVRALSEFLLASSQPFEYIDPPAGITEKPSAERGKWLFESRGCLACHSHVDFPGIQSTQGPDLSRVAAKFNTGKGQRWLYSWLKAPNHYYSRTAMPNLFLDPIVEADATGKPTGKVSDPAADIKEYLLSVPANWQPEIQLPSRELTAEDNAALEDLTAVWLSASFPKRLAQKYAREGIPYRLGGSVKVDEQVLVADPTTDELKGAPQIYYNPSGGMTAANRVQRQLEYVAKRSLSRYGCFGCHDIPGYENAKPIGTTLANWGRKDTSQLAFENITTFLATHGLEDKGTPAAHGEHGGEHAHELDPDDFDDDVGYFLRAINSHQRNGFLWQKLRMPRSFDYATTRTKRYDERLRMPKFPFNEEEREQVMTFILGLVSEPPSEKYIFRHAPRQQAIVQGRHVLEKYNCAGCHMLDMERWQFAFDKGQFEDPPKASDFPFLAPDVSEEQIKASLTPDRRGFLHADVHGLTTRNQQTGEPNRVDEDGVAIALDDTESKPFYEFSLYQPAVVSGAVRLVGLQNLLIPAKPEGAGPAHGRSFAARGGDLAKYLFPRVIAETHKTDPAAKGSEAWGWLPPPLHNEGGKVQTEWLHDFLMDPTAIRPAVVLRMPNFHMSSDEASKLVNYFAAKSDAEFPYEYNKRRRTDYLSSIEQAHPKVFNDAMKIVTDGNYCVKCHSVGDYQAKGAVKTMGPNLAEVYKRLRPDFVRRWVGNPVRILPYTGMPVNIPYDPSAQNLGGVSQSLFPGTSIQQLDGLVDMLMNFDVYAKRQTSIKGMVKEAPPAQGGNPPGGNAAAPPPTEPRIDQSARQ